MSSSSSPSGSPATDRVLPALAAELRGEGSVISKRVVESKTQPALGLLAAAGPRAAGAPGEYALVVEAIREGYLLHYGRPRLLAGDDPDLALLAGDHLYAKGLARLAALGDLEAVRELADLISLCARLHAGGYGAAVPALWLAAATAIGAGASAAHEEGKRRLRGGDGEAASRLWEAARRTAMGAGIGAQLESAAEAIGFASAERP